jgi:hypothetical protein
LRQIDVNCKVCVPVKYASQIRKSRGDSFWLPTIVDVPIVDTTPQRLHADT